MIIDEQPYECKVELLEKGTEATSQAVYIHSLGCNPSGIGYFAGTNEFGTFKVDKGQVEIDTTIKAERISYGVFDFERSLFFICKTDQVECWNWPAGKPTLKWVMLVPTLSQGLAMSDRIGGNYFYTGHKDGSIQKREIDSGKLIHTYPLDGDPIRTMTWAKGNGIAVFEKGGLVRFGKDGDEHWRTFLPIGRSINGITFAVDAIWVTDADATIFKVNFDTGRVMDTYNGLEKPAAAASVVLSNEWLVYDSPGYIRWLQLKNPGFNSLLGFAEGVRTFAPVRNGVLVGDDHGKIQFLRKP